MRSVEAMRKGQVALVWLAVLHSPEDYRDSALPAAGLAEASRN
jgi:hypothetical protein